VAHIPQTARTPTRRHSSGRLKTPQGTGDDKPIYHLDERGMAEGGMAEGGMAEGGMAEGEMAEGVMVEGGMAEGRVDEGGMAEGGMAEGGVAYRATQDLTYQDEHHQDQHHGYQAASPEPSFSASPDTRYHHTRPTTALVHLLSRAGGRSRFAAPQAEMLHQIPRKVTSDTFRTSNWRGCASRGRSRQNVVYHPSCHPCTQIHLSRATPNHG